MRYTFSELEVTYLLDLLSEMQTEVTDDTLDEIDQAIEMLQGVMNEQIRNGVDEPIGDGCVGTDTGGSEGSDRHFESGQYVLPASVKASK